MFKNKKFIYIAAAIVVLVFAFWYGGGSPSSQGFFIKGGEAQHVTVSASDKETETTNPSDKTTENSDANQENNPDGEQNQAENTYKNNSTETKDSPNHEERTSDSDTAKSDTAQGSEQSGSSSQKSGNDGETGTQTNTHGSATATSPVTVKNQEKTEKAVKEAETQSKTCTISISCATILNNMDWLDKTKKELIPADGWILKPVKVPFNEGESVFNILQRTCKQEGIQMEFSNTPIYKSAYIEGIYNLCEFDCGEQSGWMYKVNDWFPNYGCSKYTLKDGDVICWEYTCDLGKDVGGSFDDQTAEE